MRSIVKEGRSRGKCLFNLISAVGVDAGAQDIEMPKLEGGEGFIDQVIKPRCLNTLAFNRLRYPRRIQLLNLGLKGGNNLFDGSLALKDKVDTRLQ
jgi:hypothetical protein